MLGLSTQMKFLQRVTSGIFVGYWDAIDKENDSKFFIKYFSKNTTSKEQRDKIFVEIERLKNFDYPLITKPVGFFEDDNYFYTVYPAPNDGAIPLSQFAKEHGAISENATRIWLQDFNRFSKYITDRHLHLYDSITADSIYVDADGLMTNVYITFKNSDIFVENECAVQRLVPPEILTTHEAKEASDIWSVGVLLFVISCGYFPFNGETKDEISKEILSAHPNYPPSISQSLKLTISQMLTKNQLMRDAGRRNSSNAMKSKSMRAYTIQNVANGIANGSLLNINPNQEPAKPANPRAGNPPLPQSPLTPGAGYAMSFRNGGMAGLLAGNNNNSSISFNADPGHAPAGPSSGSPQKKSSILNYINSQNNESSNSSSNNASGGIGGGSLMGFLNGENDNSNSKKTNSNLIGLLNNDDSGNIVSNNNISANVSNSSLPTNKKGSLSQYLQNQSETVQPRKPMSRQSSPLINVNLAGNNQILSGGFLNAINGDDDNNNNNDDDNDNEDDSNAEETDEIEEEDAEEDESDDSNDDNDSEEESCQEEENNNGGTISASTSLTDNSNGGKVPFPKAQLSQQLTTIRANKIPIGNHGIPTGIKGSSSGNNTISTGIANGNSGGQNKISLASGSKLCNSELINAKASNKLSRSNKKSTNTRSHGPQTRAARLSFNQPQNSGAPENSSNAARQQFQQQQQQQLYLQQQQQQQSNSMMGKGVVTSSSLSYSNNANFPRGNNGSNNNQQQQQLMQQQLQQNSGFNKRPTPNNDSLSKRMSKNNVTLPKPEEPNKTSIPKMSLSNFLQSDTNDNDNGSSFVNNFINNTNTNANTTNSSAANIKNGSGGFGSGGLADSLADNKISFADLVQEAPDEGATANPFTTKTKPSISAFIQQAEVMDSSEDEQNGNSGGYGLIPQRSASSIADIIRKRKPPNKSFGEEGFSSLIQNINGESGIIKSDQQDQDQTNHVSQPQSIPFKPIGRTNSFSIKNNGAVAGGGNAGHNVTINEQFTSGYGDRIRPRVDGYPTVRIASRKLGVCSPGPNNRLFENIK